MTLVNRWRLTFVGWWLLVAGIQVNVFGSSASELYLPLR
jgi:hypothetical protein